MEAEMEQDETTKKPRGFATLSPERRREIARAGGKAAQASGRGHRYTAEEARAAGAKGGTTTAQRPGHMQAMGRRGGANIAADREHMAEIGRKGGAMVARRAGHMEELARKSVEKRQAEQAGNGAPAES